MAELIIQCIQQRRQKLFRVSLRSDEDTTPREHEQDHTRLIRRLLPGIDLDNPAEGIEVARERPQQEPHICCGGQDGGYEVIDLG